MSGHEHEFGLMPLEEVCGLLPPTRLGRVLETHRAEIRSIVAAHGGGSVGVFGSIARGDDHEDSDLDLLVELPARTGILTIGAIAREISEIVGVDVDIVPEAALRPDCRDEILAQVIRL